MVHQYKNNGYNIVLDVNSGSVHVVDDIVYDMIPYVEAALRENITDPQGIVENIVQKSTFSYNREEVNEAVSEILELKNADMLFTDDIYEDYIDSFKNRETVVKALCLHIAHDCNLACK